MTVDPQKLREFAATLTDDQVQLLREGLAEGGDLDPDALVATFGSEESQGHLKALGAERTAPAAEAEEEATTSDAGVGDGGAGPVKPEPPLTRW
jgi:hypothetical protein